MWESRTHRPRVGLTRDWSAYGNQGLDVGGIEAEPFEGMMLAVRR